MQGFFIAKIEANRKHLIQCCLLMLFSQDLFPCLQQHIASAESLYGYTNVSVDVHGDLKRALDSLLFVLLALLSHIT